MAPLDFYSGYNKSSLMHYNKNISLNFEEITAVNEAFAEAGEVDKLAEIHLNKTSDGYPLRTYFDTNAVISTIKALKTRPEVLEQIVKDGGTFQCEHDESLLTLYNFHEIKNALKDSPQALVAVVNKLGFLITPETYGAYFTELRDMPEVLAKMDIGHASEIKYYTDSHGNRVSKVIVHPALRAMLAELIGLAKNPKLSPADSYNLLKKYKDSNDEYNIVSQTQYKKEMEKLLNILIADDSTATSSVWNNLITRCNSKQNK